MQDLSTEKLVRTESSQSTQRDSQWAEHKVIIYKKKKSAAQNMFHHTPSLTHLTDTDFWCVYFTELPARTTGAPLGASNLSRFQIAEICSGGSGMSRYSRRGYTLCSKEALSRSSAYKNDKDQDH